MATSPPKPTIERLLKDISKEFDSLSKQLKLIARHVEQHREHIGLEGIQEMAAHCGVQPSAVIRFAKHFGFSGFSEMQKLFRDGISKQIVPSRNYQSRIREVIAAGQSPTTSVDIAHEFLGSSIADMQELQRSLHAPTFVKAVELLVKADSVWIAGARRSFPVAAYLGYALQHTDKRIQLLTALGSMHEAQLRSLRTGDVMIAISFTPYAEETAISTSPGRTERSWPSCMLPSAVTSWMRLSVCCSA